MARSRKDNTAGVDPTSLGSGTYFVPGLGTVFNGEVLDGDDPEAVQAFHEREAKDAEQAQQALAERDAEIVDVVRAENPSAKSDGGQ